MKIRIDWCENGNRGYMEVDADRFIDGVSLTTYRNWVKLFVKYGTPEQHEAFIERIQIHINVEDNEKKIKIYQRKLEILKGLLQ